jgi:hypothetical protein
MGISTSLDASGIGWFRTGRRERKSKTGDRNEQTRPGRLHEQPYFSSLPSSGVIAVPAARALSAMALGDTISPLAFR